MAEAPRPREVELECAVYGEGTVFPVKIARDAKVSALQEAIAAIVSTEQHAVPARLLTLYVAKKKNGEWLKDDASLDDLLATQIDTAYTKMRSSWKLSKSEYFGDFELGEETIHVLVELPPIQSADPRLLELQESLLHHVLLDAPSSTSARSQSFKKNLCARYNCDMGNGMLRCMLLDTALPSEVVIASHLFRRKNEFLSEKLMGIPDIDDVRNGLLLFKPLEHAFDHFQISFIYDQSSNEFRMKIFDRSVRRLRLLGKLDQTQRAVLLQGKTLPKDWRLHGEIRAPGTSYNLQTKFGDLEGRALQFHSLARPFKRCLNLQARLARKKAIENKWIKPDEDDFQDFWSEGMSLAEKMKYYFANEAL